MEIQYVLSKQEYKDLVEHLRQTEEKARQRLQRICTKIADTCVTELYDYKGDVIAKKVIGCICTETGPNQGGYCDDCIVRDICPKEWKNFSK